MTDQVTVYTVEVRELGPAHYEATFKDSSGAPLITQVGRFPFDAISNAAISQNNRDYAARRDAEGSEGLSPGFANALRDLYGWKKP